MTTMKKRSRENRFEQAFENGNVMEISRMIQHGFNTSINGTKLMDSLSKFAEEELETARVAGSGGLAFSCGRSDFQLGYATGARVDVQYVPRHIPNIVNVARVAAARFHTAAICTDGSLYTWGHGTGGRLGHGDETTLFEPTKVKALTGSVVSNIALGENHSLALVNGSIYAWGSNKHAQLGIGGQPVYPTDSKTSTKQDSESNLQFQLTPKKVKLPREHPTVHFVDIAASSMHSIAASRKGKVFSWGSNAHGELGQKDISNSRKHHHRPALISQLDRMEHVAPVVQVVAADGVSAVLCSDGRVYQWGHGSSAPSRVLIRTAPRPRGTCRPSAAGDHQGFSATAVSSVLVESIAAGAHHMAAVSRDGEVYTWGGSAHLLGHCRKGNDRLPTCSHIAAPMKVDALAGLHVVAVECGRTHTVALDSSGCVHTWGEGDHGVLGREASYQPAPERVDSVARVSSIAAAECTTVFLCCMSQPRSFWKGMPGTLKVGLDERGRALGLREAVERALAKEEDASDVESDVDGDASGKKEIPTETKLPSLFTLAQAQLASTVDLFNVVQLWTYAEALHATSLDNYCRAYIKLNLDAMVLMNPHGLEILCEYQREWYGRDTIALMDGDSDCDNATNKREEHQGSVEEDTHLTLKAPSDMDITELKRRIKQCHKRTKRLQSAKERLDSMSNKVTDSQRQCSQTDLDAQLVSVLERLSLYTVEMESRGEEALECVSPEVLQSPSSQLSPSHGMLTLTGSPLVLPEQASLAPPLAKKSDEDEALGDRDPLYCEICDVTVPDSAAMVDHYEGRRHHKSLARESKANSSEAVRLARKPKPSRGRLAFRTSAGARGAARQQKAKPSPNWQTASPNGLTRSPSRTCLREILKEEQVRSSPPTGPCLTPARASPSVLSSSPATPGSRTLSMYSSPRTGAKPVLLSSFISKQSPVRAWQPSDRGLSQETQAPNQELFPALGHSPELKGGNLWQTQPEKQLGRTRSQRSLLSVGSPGLAPAAFNMSPLLGSTSASHQGLNSWGFQPKPSSVQLNEIQTAQMVEQFELERQQEEAEIAAAIAAVEEAERRERQDATLRVQNRRTKQSGRKNRNTLVDNDKCSYVEQNPAATSSSGGRSRRPPKGKKGSASGRKHSGKRGQNRPQGIKDYGNENKAQLIA